MQIFLKVINYLKSFFIKANEYNDKIDNVQEKLEEYMKTVDDIQDKMRSFQSNDEEK